MSRRACVGTFGVSVRRLSVVRLTFSGVIPTPTRPRDRADSRHLPRTQPPSAPLTETMRTKSSITIVIADDQPIFRLGIKALLTQQTGFTVLGEASDTEAATAMIANFAPDVLLVDHQPPRLHGLEVVRRLRLAKSPTRAVMLTTTMRESDIQQALLHGAWGVVLKHTAGDVLPQCLRQVMLGEHWIGVESVNALIGTLRTPSTGGSTALTPREVDIVRRVAKGASNKDIAWELKMGEQTVKNHLRRVFRKLNVVNRVELALLAVENQIGGDGADGAKVPDAPEVPAAPEVPGA